MAIISQIYLLLFLPLIFALFCQCFAKKNWCFTIAISACVLSFSLLLKLFFNILNKGPAENNFNLDVLSIALEFNFDILSVIFLLLVLFVKIITLIFYDSDIKNILDNSNRHIFYSLFLIKIFSIFGICTTDNLLNLFVFFEIYAFSFLAILAISRDQKLLQLAFRYFCVNVVTSLLLLFCFITIYLVFGQFNFQFIANNLSLIFAFNPWFALIIFALLSAALIVKFFPFWLYFEKLKSQNSIANFLAIESLFIKTNIGIFLILKFSQFFFGIDFIFAKLHFEVLLFILALCLIFYTCYKLYYQKHLKIIAAYLILNNLGFVLAAISLQSFESMQAAFFYLLNLTLINLLIFIFASFLKKYFKSSSFNKINLINKDNFLWLAPFLMLLFFIGAGPLTILFFGNFYGIYSSLILDFKMLLLLAIIVCNFIYLKLALKLALPFFKAQNLEANLKQISPVFANKGKYHSYLFCFWIIIMTIYGSILSANFLNDLSYKFASYLI